MISLPDQPDGSPLSLLAAAHWIEGVLTGTVATAAATIAVAVCGAMLLGGRLSWRRGATVVAGCFVLFGASSIAGAFTTVAAPAPYEPIPAEDIAPHVSTIPTIAPDQPYDPFGSVSVPGNPTPARDVP